MRTIELQMMDAIRARRHKTIGNTTINPGKYTAAILLHGNHIATWIYAEDRAEAIPETLAQWPTPTTKSRLRALGVDVYTQRGITYLDGQPV